MLPNDTLALYQTLLQTNRSLSKSLSEARYAASQYDHHLAQHDSAPAFDRLQFLLAQAIAVAGQQTLSHLQKEQLLGQLDTLKQHCQTEPQSEFKFARVCQVYE